MAHLSRVGVIQIPENGAIMIGSRKSMGPDSQTLLSPFHVALEGNGSDKSSKNRGTSSPWWDGQNLRRTKAREWENGLRNWS